MPVLLVLPGLQNVNCQDWAGSQLDHTISGGTKHRKINGITPAHGHDQQVSLCLQRKFDDLLVGPADSHQSLNLTIFDPLRGNQFIELVLRFRDFVFNVGRTWHVLQYVEQGELGAVLRCCRERIFQRPVRRVGKIRTEDDLAQLDRTPACFLGR